jgi:RNA 3'-terminal phosphate cyclase (ATP)
MKTISGIHGGGQILRSALTLSMITGQAFRMNHIRAKRRKPGLMRQHLTCVKAAATICHAQIEGAEIGSTELTFHPGPITAGDYHFAIGSAGSTTLLAQTLLPALWHAKSASTLVLEGGTHNPLAPTFPFIEEIYLARLRSIGIDVNATLDETGFAPAGGGKISLLIKPATQVKPLVLLDRGERLSREVEIIARNLDATIVERFITAVQSDLTDVTVTRNILRQGPGQGVCCLVRSRYEHCEEIVSGIGEIGLSAERIANKITRSVSYFEHSGAAVNHHLADQLLLPLALHQGGRFHTLPPDEHFLTNQQTIQAFLPDVHFHIEVKENTPLHVITIENTLGKSPRHQR